MDCLVLKGDRKADTFLFLPADADPEELPGPLREGLGTLSEVMTLDLTPERSLARTPGFLSSAAAGGEGAVPDGAAEGEAQGGQP